MGKYFHLTNGRRGYRGTITVHEGNSNDKNDVNSDRSLSRNMSKIFVVKTKMSEGIILLIPHTSSLHISPERSELNHSMKCI